MRHALLLLFGMPRSGTTWIGKIFDSHPNTLYRHEPDSGGALKSIPLIAPIAEVDKFRATVTRFVDQLPQIRTPRAAGSLPIFPKRYQSSTYFLLKRFAVLATKASEAFIRDLPVPDFIDYAKVPDLHVVWKSIESMGRLGVILRVASEARAIVILRHPCGYIASVLTGEGRKQFSSSASSSEDYPVFEMLLRVSPHKKRNPVLEDLKTMLPIERLAWRWLLYNEIALEHTTGRDHCLTLRYEDLCAQPLAKARELLNFAGLDWHAQVETFVHRSTSRSSEHYYSVFKDPTESSSKWEHQLSQAHIDLIMSIIRKSDLHNMHSNAEGNGDRKYA